LNRVHKWDSLYHFDTIIIQLPFNRGSEGLVEKVTLLQEGQEITGKKLAE
jgi:hypothetical protein